ncbi:MAG: MFS transporter [Chroococcidiopsidaceae cyanobacterium CP_BM_RX_35]|nr:MFS transporter [Chroococcidiopsidaceae cyanobacterium CP_BM_RX_35]
MSGLQWIVNAYTLPATSLVLPSGTLGDIYGRKRVFLAGLVLCTMASLICGLAPSLGVLIARRSIPKFLFQATFGYWLSPHSGMSIMFHKNM